jgi:hypothetical protein
MDLWKSCDEVKIPIIALIISQPVKPGFLPANVH